MDNDNIDSKIPLLEDIETALELSEESIYPVKLQKKKDCHWKKCKHGKKGRCIKKCLKVICKVAFALFLIFSTIAVIAGYRWHRWVSEHVEQWTVTEPIALPIEDVPASELSAMKDAAKFFWDSTQYGKVPEDFVLPARDINGFIAASDFLRGNAFAEMEANEYQVSISLPTDGLPGGKGRFFVATKTVTWDPEYNEIKVTIESKEDTMVEAVMKLTTMEDDKTLNLEVLSGQAFGKFIPQDFIDERYNLLEDLYHCDCQDGQDDECKQARSFLEGLAGVSLEEGQVVVHSEVEAREATYYKEHEGHSWHHGNHPHHHGKHGGHYDKHHGKHEDHHHGGHRHRSLRAKVSGHHHWKALHMVRRLMA